MEDEIEPTFKLSIDLITNVSAREYPRGRGGIRPLLWVVWFSEGSMIVERD